jgi:hypothetical protein
MEGTMEQEDRYMIGYRAGYAAAWQELGHMINERHDAEIVQGLAKLPDGSDYVLAEPKKQAEPELQVVTPKVAEWIAIAFIGTCFLGVVYGLLWIVGVFR